VISWVLPQAEITRRDNAREEALPAKRWAFSRKYGEEFNVRLRDHVVETLTYKDHHAYCLFYRNGGCGACIDRCPAEAITREGGHDKAKCTDYSRNVCEPAIRERFGITMHACGLCQAGVPCEAGIPLPDAHPSSATGT
jgi:NAD-dependent dihydropyrimidine dehydrogenase PreA subunit